MRFIHSSDWHLGRQFHNVSLLDDQQHVLEQLIGYIQSESVDALVVAGDIYDRSVPPAAAVELLDRTLNRICSDLGVPVIIIPGNHDSAQRLSFGARQLQRSGLHIMAGLGGVTVPVVVEGRDGAQVRFFGIPYCDPEQVRNRFGADTGSHDAAHSFLVEQIVEVMAAANDKQPSVLVSHCFIDGAEESESERPLSIGGADRVSYTPLLPFDYVALGHLHSPQYRGAERIRYSGSLLKYSFSEQYQRKGVTLVEIDQSGLLCTRQLPLEPLRDMRIIEGELDELLAQGRSDPHSEDFLLVRLTDRHAILDPMGKLRQVYPNVLHLEKPGMLATGAQQMSRDKLKRNELAMFRDFFIQISGQAMTTDQDAALIKTLEALDKAPS